MIAADGEQKAARALKVKTFKNYETIRIVSVQPSLFDSSLFDSSLFKPSLFDSSLLQEASDVIAISPAALQLRYLQVISICYIFFAGVILH